MKRGGGVAAAYYLGLALSGGMGFEAGPQGPPTTLVTVYL